MNLIKRLWQWYRERRVERQVLKGHSRGGCNCSQGVPPLAGVADASRLQLLKSDPGPRIV